MATFNLGRVCCTDQPIDYSQSAICDGDSRPPTAHSHAKGDLPAAVAYEDEANVFDSLQDFDADIQFKDQDGTPVADRRLRVVAVVRPSTSNRISLVASAEPLTIVCVSGTGRIGTAAPMMVDPLL